MEDGEGRKRGRKRKVNCKMSEGKSILRAEDGRKRVDWRRGGRRREKKEEKK